MFPWGIKMRLHVKYKIPLSSFTMGEKPKNLAQKRLAKIDLRKLGSGYKIAYTVSVTMWVRGGGYKCRTSFIADRHRETEIRGKTQKEPALSETW